MRYYLARYVGSGTDDNPFRPSGSDLPDFAGAIDLRPDPTQPNGFALTAALLPLPSSPNRITLTDDPDERSATLRQRIESRLGLNLDDHPFRRLVAHLLLDHGDDANPGRWNRLRPEQDAWRVYLGGLLFEMRRVSGGATQTDDFNRADSTTLGGSWTEVIGDLEISGNELRAVGTTSTQARWDADLASSNTYCQVAGVGYSASGAQSKAVGPLVRYSTLADTYYVMIRVFTDSLAAGTLTLRSVVAGVSSNLAGPNTDTAVAGEVLKTSANGSTIKGFKDGVEVFSVTDVAIATGTRCGVRVLSGGANTRCRADNWEAGDLGGAAPVTHRMFQVF